VKSGSTLEGAANIVGVSDRTLQRWKANLAGEDRRCGPRTKPENAMTELEREQILEVVNRLEFRDLSPHQIVAILADRDEYIGSESTIYRVLREAKQLAHRGRSRERVKRPVPTHTANGPRQLWSWDITYLPTTVRGRFFYLYMFLDIWSRKIVGWEVYEREDDKLSAGLMARMRTALGSLAGLILHADNGGAMRGSTMIAKLEQLGVTPSFSRPRVSNDNPFSEALFRTVKYTPMWPDRPFDTLDEARAWVERFVAWYNGTHRHSALDYLTPDERHEGRGDAILARRRRVYERARMAHPERWTGGVRRWSAPQEVNLNRPRLNRVEKDPTHAAA
jgi:putative transposase